MAQLDVAIDAVVSDPPYGVNIASWDAEMPPQEILDECLRVASGPVLWFGGAKKVWGFSDYSPRPERLLVWAPSFTMAKTSKGWCFYRWHPIAVWRHPKSQRGCGSDVLRHPCDGRNWWNHPGTKPVDVMKSCIGFSNGQTILDPFMGSGTTLVAAKQLGRRAIGIEIEEKYCEIAANRLANEPMPLIKEEVVA